jgi:hypothetical protein
MNELLNRIFGLGGDAQSLGFGSRDAALSFVYPLPAWIGAMVIALVIFGVWWSYRSVPGARWARGVLGGMRVVALVLLFALALGPRIEQTNIEHEQDWALVLLDRSGSLTTRDAVSEDRRLDSRDEQLRAMLDSGSEQWDALSDRKHVVWMGFGERASTIAIGATPAGKTLAAPRSRSTNLGAAISSALDEASARPISSIVIASDGRSFDEFDPGLLNVLKGAQIPIFGVALGSDAPVRDLGIGHVEFPRAVFADDLVPIRVRVDASGFTPDELRSQGVLVELVDHASGRVLDSTAIELDEVVDGEPPSGGWTTLSHKPTGTGEREFDLRIRTDDGQTNNGQAGGVDLNESNNNSTIRIGVVDRPMRVLSIDGYPRWEQRYLKNLLLRERSIVSSSLLLASSRRYVQEGDELLSALPTTLEEWEPFDVVIIGDVRAELFTDEQLGSLLEHVQKHGAGVLWIAGSSSTPGTWLDSGLSALLPMHRDAGGSQSTIHAWAGPVTMIASDEASRLGLLTLNDERTGWLDRLSEPTTGWSKLWWALELDETDFKPGVSVLARARSVNTGEQAPIVTAMRYGAGRSVFVATDEIWRWRYGRGEDLPERFWVPIIRSLGRGTVDRRSAPAALSISPTHPEPNTPTRVTLRLFDQSRIDSMPEEVRVEIRSGLDGDEPSIVSLRGTGETRLGTWIPEHPGVFVGALVGQDSELAQITARVRVLDAADEQRVLDSDHELLKRLTRETGGQMIESVEFGSIPELMPNRMRTVVSEPTRASLWDRPVVLAVLVLLLGAEWVGRRILRLA